MITHEKKAVDMIFIYPNMELKFDYSLGSAYIIAYLIKKGFNVTQYYNNKLNTIENLAIDILSNFPKVIGFTVNMSNYSVCNLLARSIKNIIPNVIIIFGGPTPTAQADNILKHNNFVDLCVRNQGEETTLELLNEFKKSDFRLKFSNIEKINGISYRADNDIINNSNKLILTNTQNLKHYLDKYPSPHLSGLLDNTKIGVITARGCNQHCTYCNCTSLSNKQIYLNSIKRVIDELKYISKYKSSYEVEIYDDAFTLLPKRAEKICNKIIENKINLSLTCITRCDKINKNLIKLMKTAGFKTIGFSLESAVPRLLRIIGKVQDPNAKNDPYFLKEKEFIEKFKKYISYAHDIGLRTYASIMLGLPGETYIEAKTTVDFIESMEDKIDFYSHNILQICPGTSLYDNYNDKDFNIFKTSDKIYNKTYSKIYDSYSVKISKKSFYIENSIKKNRIGLKTMSLINFENIDTDAFLNIILISDVIDKDLIIWMQQNMVIGGTFIQIYSSKDILKKYLLNNELIMHEYLSIANITIPYYTTYNEKGKKEFKLYEEFKYDIDDNKSIKLKYLYSLILEENKLDSFYIYNKFSKITKNGFSEVLNSKIQSFIPSVCKWGKNNSNCLGLQTAIIDNKGSIKTCWNGKIVGKLGDTFDIIKENILNLKSIIEKSRGCKDCIKINNCEKCIFPNPIEESDYCQMKKSNNAENGAEFIKKVNYLSTIY
jgi:radical SAM superfamily enzyme YgiQ (UPF0313 family)